MLNFFIISEGNSQEREVSLSSANNFLKYFKSSFQIFFIHLRGNLFFFNDIQGVFQVYSDKLCFIFGQTCIEVDYVFPIIHGRGVEDGALQAYFSILGVNVIANNIHSSALSFNKIHSKQLSISLKIPVVPFIDFFLEPCITFKEACSRLNSKDLFLKPSDNGSSFGCYAVSNENQFNNAISKIKIISQYVMIEKKINKIECFCSVLFHEVSDVIFLQNTSDFFSYEDKYLKHSFKTFQLQDNKLANQIKEYSLLLFKAMQLDFICRFDFFICKDTGTLYFNEANSLPGLGAQSLFISCFKSKYNESELFQKMIRI